jgi:hypothetical protein
MGDVLFIDQDGNESTRNITMAEAMALITDPDGSCLMIALPVDQGLDKTKCYILNVKIQ